MSAVTDNLQRHRFELDLDGQIVFADYRPEGSRVILPHVEAPPALLGTGASARLMEGMLALLRERGERIMPLCSYAAGYLRRHPEHHDLVADVRPAR